MKLILRISKQKDIFRLDMRKSGYHFVQGKNSATNRMVPRVKKSANYRLACVTLTLVDPLWSKLSSANEKSSRVIDDAKISNYFLYLKKKENNYWA